MIRTISLADAAPMARRLPPEKRPGTPEREAMIASLILHYASLGMCDPSKPDPYPPVAHAPRTGGLASPVISDRGERFATVALAATAMGVNRSAVYGAIRTPSQQCCHRHWWYVVDAPAAVLVGAEVRGAA